MSAAEASGESRANEGLMSLPGAVEAGWPDEGVAAHYGDPMREQRTIEESAGIVDRSGRGVLRITGPDRLSWLHSLTTQQLEGLAAGAAAQALVLSPNGHVEHHLTLTDDGTAVWVHVEPGTAAALAEFLESMRFMLRVEVADVSQDFAVLTVLGPAAATSCRARWRAGEREPGLVRTMDLIVARDRLPEVAGGPATAGGRGWRACGRSRPCGSPRMSPARPGHRSPDHPARGRLDRERACT